MASISDNDIKNIYIDNYINLSKYENLINALKIINLEL